MAVKKRSTRKVSSIFRHELVVSRSAAGTKKVGARLAKLFKPGDVIFLEGDLGTGKTTLVQGMARGFGIKGYVRSSSFILVNEYAIPSGRFCHMDLYRLEAAELGEIGLDDYFSGGAICVIEWADRIKRTGIRPSWDIRLIRKSENNRIIEIRHQRERNRTIRHP